MRLFGFWIVFLFAQAALAAQNTEHVRVINGAERLDAYLPLLKDRQVGLVVNHTSLVGNRHLIDTLASLNVCLARIFAPEHGYRGEEEAGELVKDGMDISTGTPIVSLYGKRKKPTAEDLSVVDLVVFDIQDVGTRFYTYISTLFLVLEACAENNIPVIVLDRPNPNGHFVDGPVLDSRFESFVGIAQMPMVHGCTVGELARMFVSEYWVYQRQPLSLTVIPCLNYTHQTMFAPPVKPSPNLPNLRAILLYPSLCLFEGTVVSVGRGTDKPFQWIGHPLCSDGALSLVPRPNAAAKTPPLSGQTCRGYDFSRQSEDSLFALRRIQLNILLDFYQAFPDKSNFFLGNKFFDLLAGNARLRQQIEYGCNEAEIRATWEADILCFQEIRRKYLLYAE